MEKLGPELNETSPEVKRIDIREALEKGEYNILDLKEKLGFGDTVILSASISHDGKYFTAVGDDGRVVIYDLENKVVELVKELKKELGFSDSDIYSATISPDGKIVVFTGEKWNIAIYDLENKVVKKSVEELKKELDLRDLHGDIYSASISHDGEKVILGGMLGYSVIYDLKKEKVIKKFPFGFHNNIYSTAISSEGDIAAFAEMGENIVIYNLEKEEAPILYAMEDVVRRDHTIFSTIITPDRKYLITAGEKGKTDIYDLSYLQIGVMELPKIVKDMEELGFGDSAILSIAVSHDGKIVTFAGEKGKIAIYDLENKKVLKSVEDMKKLINFGDFNIFSTIISQDGSKIVFAGDDGKSIVVEF